MSKLKEKFPFDFTPNGGTVHDLGYSYTEEIKRIYDLLNDIRENNEGTTEPQPKQLMISENGKIYVRSLSNMNWVYIGELKENLGLNELGYIKREDIGFNIDNPNVLNININGNAGKIGGKPIVTNTIEDGEVLVYRASLGCFVNETKVSGVGAKELGFVINNDFVTNYSGVATRNLRLIATTEEAPENDIQTTKAIAWLKPVYDTSDSEIVKSEYNALDETNNYKTHYLKTSADQVVGLGRMKSFSYAVGDVVYTDNNMQVALKCTTAGTTSNTELDISNVSVGESVEDGSVVWQVVSRDTVAIINQERPIKTFTNLGQLGLSGTCTLEDIAIALPNDSILQIPVNRNNGQNPNFNVEGDGLLTVKKQSIYNVLFEFKQIGGSGSNLFTASYADWMTPKFTGWKKLAINGALSMPSNNYVNVNVTANGTYIVPSDGWLYFTGKPQSEVDGLLAIYCNNRDAFFAKTASVSQEGGDYRSFIIPFKKGDVLTFFYATLVTDGYKFYYAQSEV